MHGGPGDAYSVPPMAPAGGPGGADGRFQTVMAKITIQRILVPIDFSRDSNNALEFAKTLAEDYNAELIVLHVIEDILAPAYFGAQFDPGMIPSAELEESAHKEMERFIPATAEGPVRVRHVLRRGSAFKEIVETAKDEDVSVIVMGTHGRGPLGHLFLGSTAERVVRSSRVPVLTIRHPDRSPEE